MKNNNFKIEKLPLETLINLLMQLYDNGVDYVDLSADNSDALQDKLIITTRKGYINPKFYNEDGLIKFESSDDEEDDDDDDEDDTYEEPPPPLPLSDEDIDKLL